MAIEQNDFSTNFPPEEKLINHLINMAIGGYGSNVSREIGLDKYPFLKYKDLISDKTIGTEDTQNAKSVESIYKDDFIPSMSIYIQTASGSEYKLVALDAPDVDGFTPVIGINHSSSGRELTIVGKIKTIQKGLPLDFIEFAYSEDTQSPTSLLSEAKYVSEEEYKLFMTNQIRGKAKDATTWNNYMSRGGLATAPERSCLRPQITNKVTEIKVF